MLLDACNITNTIVFLESIDHVINAVRIEGEWYYIDTTWIDEMGDNRFFGITSETALEVYGIDMDALIVE